MKITTVVRDMKYSILFAYFRQLFFLCHSRLLILKLIYCQNRHRSVEPLNTNVFLFSITKEKRKAANFFVAN